MPRRVSSVCARRRRPSWAVDSKCSTCTTLVESNRANQLYFRSADSVDPTRARRGVLPLLTSESG